MKRYRVTMTVEVEAIDEDQARQEGRYLIYWDYEGSHVEGVDTTIEELS